MIRWLVGLFFIAHGLIHAAVWLPPFKEGAPFNPSRSWLLGILGVGEGPMRSAAVALALVAMIGFILGSLGWIAAREWGRFFPVWSAMISLLLVVVYFHPWLSFAALINVAILYQLLR